MYVCVAGNGEMLVFFRFFSQQQFDRQFSFRVEVLNHMGWYLGHKKKLTTTGNMGQHIVFCFCVFAHFSKFSMYDWGKKRKMLVFTGVYVCVKAKLTFVSFFSIFFLHLSLTSCFLKLLPTPSISTVTDITLA